jgi:integrase
MVLFALYTGGQRLSDVAALTWANVDLQRKEVRFETRKTGRRVIIPLVGPLLRHAESLPAGISPADPIHPRAFQTLKAQGRTNTLSNQFDTILSQAGLKAYGSHQGVGKGRATKRDTGKLGFHALRMTATTLMHDAGIPAATVQAIVGHESEDVHRLYIRMGRESQERALSVLPDLA